MVKITGIFPGGSNFACAYNRWMREGGKVWESDQDGDGGGFWLSGSYIILLQGYPSTLGAGGLLLIRVELRLYLDFISPLFFPVVFFT